MLRLVFCVTLLSAAMPGTLFAAADDKASVKLTAEGVNKMWADLGRHDDEGCLQAIADMERLIQAPELVVPFLGEHLKPAPMVDTSGVAKLVADLDSNDFTTRDNAFKALVAFGPKALPLLERKLQEKELSLELQNSLNRLVQAANGGAGRSPTAADLRAIRAIEVLEQIGTPPARAILDKVATGDDGSALTLRSRDAIRDLDRRGKK